MPMRECLSFRWSFKQSPERNPTMSDQVRLVRVFLSSPGDVADERALARQVLHDLSYDPLLRGCRLDA